MKLERVWPVSTASHHKQKARGGSLRGLRTWVEHEGGLGKTAGLDIGAVVVPGIVESTARRLFVLRRHSVCALVITMGWSQDVVVPRLGVERRIRGFTEVVETMGRYRSDKSFHLAGPDNRKGRERGTGREEWISTIEVSLSGPPTPALATVFSSISTISERKLEYVFFPNRLLPVPCEMRITLV